MGQRMVPTTRARKYVRWCSGYYVPYLLDEEVVVAEREGASPMRLQLECPPDS